MASYTRLYPLSLIVGGDTGIDAWTSLDDELDYVFTILNILRGTSTLDEVTDPTTSANEGAVYVKEVDSATNLCFRGESSATVLVITQNAGTKLNGGSVGGPLAVTQNSQTVGMSHDGTDSKITTNKGDIVAQTDEGTHTDTYFAIKGKGSAKGIFEIYDDAAAHKITFDVPAALTADRTITLADAAVDMTDINTNKSNVATNTSNISTNTTNIAQLGPPESIFPCTLMNYCPSGANAPPVYMYLTGGGGESVTMTASTYYTEDGWQAKVTNGVGLAARFGWNTAQNGCGNMVDVYRVRGKYITMGAWVYSTTAGRVKLEVSDGTTTTTSTSYHAGGGWEWMTVVLGAVVASGATALTAYVLIEAGAAITVYCELPCVAVGNRCPHYVGYISRNRKFQAADTELASGDIAFTGCGFTPLYYTLVMSYSGATGWGGAELNGITTTQAAADVNEAVTNHNTGASNVKYAVHKTWDVDGVTITTTVNDTVYVSIAMFEGNPR